MMKKTRLAFDLLEKEMQILHKASAQKLLGGLHFDNYEDLAAFILKYGVTDEIANKTYFSGSNGLDELPTSTIDTNSPYYRGNNVIELLQEMGRGNYTAISVDVSYKDQYSTGNDVLPGYYEPTKGIGKITSGAGTEADPFIINVPIYYGNDLTMQMQTAIMDSAYQMNHLGAVNVWGKTFKLNVELHREIDTTKAQNIAGAMMGYAGLIKKEAISAVDKLGTSSTTTSWIDEEKIMSRGYQLDKVITHEIEHILGYRNEGLGGSLNHQHTDDGSDTNMNTYASFNMPGMTRNDLEMLIRARYGFGVTGSTGYDDETYHNVSSSSAIASTGVDDIGYFQIIVNTDSSGNISNSIIHPYGTENGISQHIYEGINIIEILNSGVDDYGGYLNFSYVDGDGNLSTGYKHAYYDIPPSTGDSMV